MLLEGYYLKLCYVTFCHEDYEAIPIYDEVWNFIVVIPWIGHVIMQHCCNWNTARLNRCQWMNSRVLDVGWHKNFFRFIRRRVYSYVFSIERHYFWYLKYNTHLEVESVVLSPYWVRYLKGQMQSPMPNVIKRALRLSNLKHSRPKESHGLENQQRSRKVLLS